jgi:hypothetical protein
VSHKEEESKVKAFFATIATLLMVLALLQNLALAEQVGIQPFIEGVLGAIFPIFLALVSAVLYMLAFSKKENPFG